MITQRLVPALRSLSQHHSIISDYSELMNSDGSFSSLNKRYSVWINKELDFANELAFALSTISLVHELGENESFGDVANIVIGTRANVAAFHIVYKITVDILPFWNNKIKVYFLQYNHNFTSTIADTIKVGWPSELVAKLALRTDEVSLTQVSDAVLCNFFSNHSPEEIFQIGIGGLLKYNALGGNGKFEFDYKRDVPFRESDFDYDLHTGDETWDAYIPKYDKYSEDAFDGISGAHLNID